MKKGIIVSLLDKVIKLQENGHYASLDVSNYGYNVSVSAIKGGFRSGNGYDYHKDLMFDNSEKILKTLIELDEIIEEWGKENNELPIAEG